MHRVNIAEATVRLPDLFDAAIGGEEIVIVKDGQQAVQLVPFALPQRSPHFGSAKELVAMADDFDAPLKDFKEYMA